MSRPYDVALGAIAVVLLVTACDGQQNDTQRSDAYPAVADLEEPAAGEPADRVEPQEMSEEAASRDPAAAESESQASEGPAGPPAAVAPAPGVEQPAMKNWMLIEFAGPVEPEDLRWLEESGFRVDTVLSTKMVRGWLEEPAGGEAIAQDPRITRIHPQMR